jgi:uncharacterized protein (TIGR02001 family)
MKRWMSKLLACATLLPATLPAAPRWDGGVTLASDNLLRGVSRSSNDPAISADAQVQFASGIFGGLWASTSRVREADDTTVELAATLGFAAALRGNWSIRGSYAHYESPWQHRADFYRYDELTLDLRYRESLFFSVSYSPNTSRYGSGYGPSWDGETFAYEASYQHSLGSGLRAHAGVGYYDLSDLFGESYWYGSIGLGWSWRHWQADLSWVDTDDSAESVSYAGNAGGRALFVLGFRF